MLCRTAVCSFIAQPSIIDILAPMIYSAFTNGKQTMYNTVIFDESKNYDSGISLMFLRNKTRNITNDEFIEFTKNIWLNIFYKY